MDKFAFNIFNIFLSLAFGDVFRFGTENTYTFRRNLVNLTGFDTLYFTVKACSDARIYLLTNNTTDFNQTPYEILIGGWSNQQSAIIRRAQRHVHDVYVKIRTPGELQCDHLQPYYTSVINGSLTVGRGYVRGQEVMLQWRDPNPIPWSYARFTTGWRSTGIWQIRTDQAVNAEAEVPERRTFSQWRSVRHQEHIVFHVRACTSAYVFLAPFMGANDTGYTVVLGDESNTRSVIRRGQTVYAVVETPNILDCNGFRPFWISWLNGNINVGLGDVIGQHVFLSWQSPASPTIRAVGFSTEYTRTATYKHQFLRPPQPDEPVQPVPPPTLVPSQRKQGDWTKREDQPDQPGYMGMEPLGKKGKFVKKKNMAK